MTTIKSLPGEIIFMISKELDDDDLQACQQVCRSWYHSAHLAFLDNITLYGIDEMEKFIKAINCNPNPSYLKAVKTINLFGLDKASLPLCHFKFGEDVIKKLFFRFPNLQHVYFEECDALVKEFDDKICKTLLKKCPRLDNFDLVPILGHKESRYTTYYKVRHLATSLQIGNADGQIGFDFGSVVNFVAKFSRLRHIASLSNSLDHFGKLLPIFEKLQNLKSISLRANPDDMNSAEAYLLTRSQEVQDLIIKRLSQITELEMNYSCDYCVNSIKFVAEYLTGLNSFNLVISNFNAEWHQAEQQFFCNTVLDIICSTKGESCVKIDDMPYRDVKVCFPSIMDKVYDKVSSARKLQLSRTWITDFNDINLLIQSSLLSKKITVFLSERWNMDSFLDLFKTTDNVDEFTLDLAGDGYHDNTETSLTYERVFGRIPSVKKLVLDIPSTFLETTQSFNTTYPLVEDLTLRPSLYAKFGSLLTRFNEAFPYLKRLNLYYFAGEYNMNYRIFCIEFPKYSLERLTIDLTPVKRKMCEYAYHYNFSNMEKAFAVIQVLTIGNNERNLYKMPLDMSTVTRVNSSDLKNLRLGKDYLQVNVTVKNLKRLDVYMYYGENELDKRYLHDLDNLHFGVNHRNVFSN